MTFHTSHTGTVQGPTVTYSTDWLASRPVFYNEKLGKVSHNVNDVIDFANVEFDPEGLNNYLDFGYSVFGQTPVRNVRFLRHSSNLSIDERGKIKIEHLSDPVDCWADLVSNEDDVLGSLADMVKLWESSVKGEIIIPTSGGYDSRLLTFFVQDKTRIRSFTYGISDNQAESHEVVHARKLSELLGTKWQQVELGDFHMYFEEWDRLFGVSTHAHGMYHIEFFKTICSKMKGNYPFLSGIIGDLWAGSVDKLNIPDSRRLPLLGYTHGLHADSLQSRLHADYSLREQYYLEIREKLMSPIFNVVETVRLKMILLSYLLIVPEYSGFNPWSPFINESIARSIVSLPPHRRNNRRWQTEFFQKQGLNFETMSLAADRGNSLNIQAMNRVPLAPLSETYLSELVNPGYIRWINRTVQPMSATYKWVQRTYPNFARYRGGYRPYIFVRKIIQRNTAERLRAYSAYLTLKPLEKVLRRRDIAQAIAK